jgi:hypothetical protein
MENTEAPQPNLFHRWGESFEAFIESIADLFLALSCIVFYGLKILFKSVFYGGPNKKKPWIVVLIKLAIQVLTLVLQRKEDKKKKPHKKGGKKENL